MFEEPKAGIFKLLRSPGIDSKESTTPAYVSWRAGTTNRVIVPGHQATYACGIDWDRFLGIDSWAPPLNVYKFGLCAVYLYKPIKICFFIS